MSSLSNWYVFDGGQVLGPYDSDYLHDYVQTAGVKQSRLLVSQRGMDQWYPIRHFDDLVNLIQTKPSPLEKQRCELESFLENSLHKLRHLQSELEERTELEKRTATIQPVQRQSKKPVLSWPAHLTSTETSPKSEEQTFENVAPVEPPSEKVQPMDTPTPTPIAARPPEPVPNILEIYMLSKGRLRLGDIRSPSRVAFWHFLFSCGISSVFWFENALREVNWHSDGDYKSHRIGRTWQLLVPGYQAWLYFCLARRILEIEQQNGDRYTKPWLTVSLAFFPPLAIYYLQRVLNRHWLLHARQRV